MTDRKKGIGAIFGSLMRGVDLSRRIVANFLFVLLLIFVLAALGGGGGAAVPSEAALVLAPQGVLVEQLSGDPLERAMDEALGSYVAEELMDDLLDAIAAAKDDDRIQAIYLSLNSFQGGGLDKLQRLHGALEDFKAAGKTVVASADMYTRGGYLVASAANEVHLHPMGAVLLDGYGRYRTYHREAIERLELDWNVFKVGEFKSAVEPYLRDNMSDEAREANMEYLGDLWTGYLEHVAAARNINAQELRNNLDAMAGMVTEAEGHLAQVALNTGLVDHLSKRTEVRQRMMDQVGANDSGTSFSQVSMDEYLEALGESRHRHKTTGDGVGVVVARGTILDGTQPPGKIGGDSTAQLIRQARNDDTVKAIVLRVDSGGGSALASEVIREELAAAREDGKKVVVSMGSVAASGGYWVATSSDEIWASPNTITGSIGIFGMIPTYQKPLAKYLGTRVDGVGTNWLAGALRPDRELDPRVGEIIQANVERGYRQFLDRVAEARDMTPAEVDPYARGRVWSGSDAHDIGLVDQLGDLDEAIASAAALAGLGDDYAVRIIEKELELSEQIAAQLLAKAESALGFFNIERLTPPKSSMERRLMDNLNGHLEFLSLFDDPMHVYAHCLCEVE